MSQKEKLINDLTNELDTLKEKLAVRESELKQKDELLGQYWETIQSMRLVNRFKSTFGIYRIRKFRNYYGANLIWKNSHSNDISICIKLPIPNWLGVKNWGDFHFALSLAKYLRRLNYKVKIHTLEDEQDKAGYDVNIVIRGLRGAEPQKGALNIMWNISHPLDVTLEEYKSYDHVFVASDYYADKLQSSLGDKVSPLLQCTDTELFYPRNVAKDDRIVFVGNSHGQIRPIVKACLDQNIKINIYGKDWEGLVDDNYIIGPYIPNKKLSDVYSRSGVILNDHWPDMRDLGFVSNRVFDVLACDVILVTDYVQGMPLSIEENIAVWNGYDLNHSFNRIKKLSDQKSFDSSSHSFLQRSSFIDTFIKQNI